VNSPTSTRTTLKNCGVFTVSVVALSMLLAGPAYWLASVRGLEGLAYSAVLCWVPGCVMFLGIAGLIDNKAVAFLIGTGLRMMTVLLGALLIHQTRADLGLREFFGWLVVFYSVTLLVETLLLVGVQSSGCRNAG
jgi:hypothetical protein